MVVRTVRVKTTVNPQGGALILQSGHVPDKDEAVPNVIIQLLANLFDKNEGAREVRILYKHNEYLALYGVGGNGFSESDLIKMNSMFLSEKGADSHGMHGTGKVAATGIAEKVHYYTSSKFTGRGHMLHFQYSGSVVAEVLSGGESGEEKTFEVVEKSSDFNKVVPEFGTYIVFEGVHWDKFDFPKRAATFAQKLAERIPESMLPLIQVNESCLPQRLFNSKTVHFEENVEALGRVEVTLGLRSTAGQHLYLGGKFAQVDIFKFLSLIKAPKESGESKRANMPKDILESYPRLAVLKRPELAGIITMDILAKYRSSESFGTLKHEFTDEKDMSKIIEFLLRVAKKVENEILVKVDSVTIKDEGIRNTIQKTLETVFGKQPEAKTIDNKKHSGREFTLNPANVLLLKGETGLINIVSSDPEKVEVGKVKNLSVTRKDSKVIEVQADKVGKYQLSFQQGTEQIFAHITVVEEKSPYITPMTTNVAPGETTTTFKLKNVPEDAEIEWEIDGMNDHPLFQRTEHGTSVSFSVAPSTKTDTYRVVALCKGKEVGTAFIVVKESTKYIQPIKIEDHLYFIKSTNIPGSNQLASVFPQKNLCVMEDKTVEVYPIHINVAHKNFLNSIGEEVYTLVFIAIVKFIYKQRDIEITGPDVYLDKVAEMLIEFKQKLQ